ncbi:MFS transporter [Spirillospora sp. NPDC048911]|uniref:MFS transporter n=1 Tax=Spirillospora sp. NPDC048911 TaxID=3364527 RepID=UPI0037179E69
MQAFTSRFVPPAGAPRVLAAAQLAGSLGDGAFLVCSALFFIRVVGMSPGQIGLGLTVAWAAGSFAGVPLGALADRRGPRGTAILLALATPGSVGAFLTVRSFLPFVLAACLYASFQSGLGAARQALLAGLVEPGRRTEARAFLQSTANAGLAIGAALGGLALQFDTEGAYLAIFAVDAVAFLVTGLILTRLPALPPAPPVESGEPKLAVLRDRPYALLTLINTVMLLYMPMLSLVMPLWVVERTGAPRWTVAAMLVINTVCVVLFQVRVARGVTGLASATRFVRLAGMIMLACCAVFALSAYGSSAWPTALILLAGVVLQVAGEMFLAAGAWEIGFGLAPARRQGQYQGFFGMGVPLARMLGPVLLTTLIMGWGAPGWLVLGAIFLAAGSAMAPAVRWAERTRHAAAPEPVPTPPPATMSAAPLPTTP